MAAPSTSPGQGVRGERRSPTQRRSRERVAKILDTAADLVVREGVDALSTRTIADEAGVPVASIYQYFADKDQIIIELVERDTEEMDAHLVAAVAGLETLSIRSVVTASMQAFIDVYGRRKEFVAIYFHGRANSAVLDFCRDHHRHVAKTLYDVMSTAGLLTPEAGLARGEFAVEIGDRILECAFRDGFTGDRQVIDDGIEILVGYLERFAAKAGLDGVDRTR